MQSGASDQPIADQQQLRARLPDGRFFYYPETTRDPVSWVAWLGDLEDFIAGQDWAGSLLGVMNGAAPWSLKFAFLPNELDASIQQYDPATGTWVDTPSD